MFAVKILLTVVSFHILPIASILLDIHIPLPEGCLLTQALRANLLLQETSRPPLSKDGTSETESSRESIDLFTKHRAHITLYLADFDLEAKSDNETAPIALNQTKVDAFLKTIDSLNFTSIDASSCPLTFTAETPASSPSATESFFSINNEKYFIINGAYTMIPVKINACLQNLSDSLLTPLRKFLKLPAQIPSWVQELPEEEMKEKVSKINQYGSPNVLENFEPHVTVGYDENHSNRRLQEDPCPSGQCKDLEGLCQPIISCFADPCTEVPGEKCDKGEVCKTNFCGGCNFQCESLAVNEFGMDQSQLRVDAMDQWNSQFQTVSGECYGNVLEIAVGRTGLGGTVLTGSELKFWEFTDYSNDDISNVLDNKMESAYVRVEE